MNTQRLPIFAPGTFPAFAICWSVMGCTLSNSAACSRFNVLISNPF